MKIDMSRLIDLMIEADNNALEYYKSCADYKRKHGYGVYIDMAHGLSDEKIHIVYADKWKDSGNDAVRAVLDVLSFDEDQKSRLRSAYRAMKRWYEKETQWQRLPSSELIDRITAYVIGNASKSF